MQSEIILPRDNSHWLALRRDDITSTEISSLFGCSPYLTAFELWHRKKEKTKDGFIENDRMRWGRRLESSIAQGIAEDEAFEIRAMKEYIRDPERRLGASFDFSILKYDNEISAPYRGTAPPPDSKPTEVGLLEIKNVDALAFKEGWIVDGDFLEAPLHIELQVQQQLLLSGREFAKIGALIGGNKVVLLHRTLQPEVAAAIQNKAAEFWKSIDENISPEPKFPEDSGFIAQLYNFAEPGKVINASNDQEISQIAALYRDYGEAESRARDGKQEMKAKLLIAMGTAEKLLGDGFSVSASVVGPAKVEYERSAYRTFRCNFNSKKNA